MSAARPTTSPSPVRTVLRALAPGLALAVAIALPACKKETPAPTAAGSDSAAKTTAQPATGTAPAVSPAAPPAVPPGLTPTSVAERKAEIQKLVGEVPAESKGGDTPEAAARAFVEAAAKGDMATVKSLLLSSTDVKSFVPADKVSSSIERIARVLYKIRKPIGAVEVLAFEPGQIKEMKAGERGFLASVTVMMRGKVKARVNGKERTLRVRSMVKMGDRWKIAEL